MNYPPFAGESPPKSAWGFGWSPSGFPIHGVDNARSNGHTCDSRTRTSSRNSNEMNDEQIANMPEVLLNTLKREKKPFTYTPGDVNLSEVLADRLQKRTERKKKLSMERAAQSFRLHQENDTPLDNLPLYEQPKQLLVMPTYNTPLNMYSVENALEVLEFQAEMAVKDKGIPAPNISHSQTLPRNHTFRFAQDEPPRNVTQSRAFRVLQVITDTDEEPEQKDKYQKYFPEETRFTGLRDTKTNPSKFFHTLQRITGTEEEEEEIQDKPQLVAVSKVMNAQGNYTPGPPEVWDNKEPQAQQMRYEERVPHHPQTNSPKFTVTNQKKVVQEQKNGPLLKRPAAFLPGNMTSSRFVSHQSPPYFQRGPIDPRGGTNL